MKDEGNGKSGPMASLIKLRRRLTVGGATETVDGVSKLSVSDEVANAKQKYFDSQVRCAVSAYSGVSKKGHAPYNPRKKNQDALIMADDPSTNTLILCVLDGHGEHGDAVSGHIRDHLANEMINHQAWKTDIKKASRDAILKVEHQIIRNFRIATEFSGTTLSMAVIRGNKIIAANVGDSRVIIGKQVNGKLVAEEFTRDHKPDSPGERERIIAAGGRVFAVEYDDGIDGLVEICRVLGAAHPAHTELERSGRRRAELPGSAPRCPLSALPGARCGGRRLRRGSRALQSAELWPDQCRLWPQ